MKIRVVLIAYTITTCFLQGCAPASQPPTQTANNFIHRQKVVALTKEKYPRKSPGKIALYSPEKKPQTPYRIIGVASISKRNFVGLSRPESTLQKMMKNLAASMGGDGIMNLSNHSDRIEAQIIAYQKILI